MTNARVMLITRSTEAAQNRVKNARALIHIAMNHYHVKQALKTVGMTVTVISLSHTNKRTYAAIVKRGGNPVGQANDIRKVQAARAAALKALDGLDILLSDNLDVLKPVKPALEVVNHDAA